MLFVITKKIKLCGNKLSTFGARILANSLLQASHTLTDLDIGENGLLSLQINEFALIMNYVPKTITSLRVCERKGYQEPREISARFLYHPPHIKILDLSNSNLLNLSMKDFVDIVLANLPQGIEGLDLSSNNLFRRPVESLVYLFSHFPPQIKILNINDNNLYCLASYPKCAAIFSEQPEENNMSRLER